MHVKYGLKALLWEAREDAKLFKWRGGSTFCAISAWLDSITDNVREN